MDQPEDIFLGILPARELNSISDILEALLKPGCIVCIDPENPCIRRLIVDLICIFDSKM